MKRESVSQNAENKKQKNNEVTSRKHVEDILLKYIIDFDLSVDLLQVQKYLYYIYGFYYAFYDRDLYKSDDFRANKHGIIQPSSNKRFRDYTEHYRGKFNYDFKIQKSLIENLDIDLSKCSKDIINTCEFVLAMKVPLSSDDIRSQNHNEDPWLNSSYSGKEIYVSDSSIIEYFKRSFPKESIEHNVYFVIFNESDVSKIKNGIKLLPQTKLICLMEFMDKTWLDFWKKSDYVRWPNQRKSDCILSDLYFPNDLIEFGDKFYMSYEKRNVPDLLINSAKKGNFLALVHLWNMLKFLEINDKKFYNICKEYFEYIKSDLKTIPYSSLSTIQIILDIDIPILDKNDPEYMISTFKNLEDFSILKEETPTSLLKKSQIDRKNAQNYFKKGYEMNIPYFYLLYAQYLKNTENIKEAEKILYESIENFSTFGSSYLELFFLYLEENKEKSTEILEKALKNGHEWAVSFLSEFYRINKNFEKEKSILSQGPIFIAPLSNEQKYETLIEDRNEFIISTEKVFEEFSKKIKYNQN